MSKLEFHPDSVTRLKTSIQVPRGWENKNALSDGQLSDFKTKETLLWLMRLYQDLWMSCLLSWAVLCEILTRRHSQDRNLLN